MRRFEWSKGAVGIALLVAASLVFGAGCGSGGGSGGGSSSSGSATTGGTSGTPGTTPASPVPVRPGVFNATGDMSRGRFFHSVTRLPDGRALVAGGLEAASFVANLPLPTDTAELYDPVTRSFSRTGSLTTVRFSHAAVAEGTGTVLIIGGDLFASVDRYDPQTGTFARAGGLLTSRVQHTATLLPTGKILLTGGLTISLSGGVSTNALRSTELFDPATGNSVAGPDMPTVRVGQTATLLDTGDVLIVGGTTSLDTLLYRTGAGQFTAGPPLARAREDHRATMLGDGRLLVTAGSERGTSHPTAEILDVGASAFRMLPSILNGIGREDHTQTLLHNGTVLITGGEDNGAGPQGADLIVPSAMLFDPISETFLFLPDTLVPRDDHRAVLLLDGTVLLLGGEDVNGSGLRSAEIYTP